MHWIESILLKAYMWASRPNWSLHPMPQISHLNTPNSLSSPLPSIFFCKYFVETLIIDICLSCLVFFAVEVHLHVLGTRAENLANITEETGTLVGFLCLHLQKRWKISHIQFPWISPSLHEASPYYAIQGHPGSGSQKCSCPGKHRLGTWKCQQVY